MLSKDPGSGNPLHFSIVWPYSPTLFIFHLMKQFQQENSNSLNYYRFLVLIILTCKRKGANSLDWCTVL